MNEKQFIYTFSICGKTVYSQDTVKSLIERANNVIEKEKIKHFIRDSEPGDFMVFEPFGEIAFRTK